MRHLGQTGIQAMGFEKVECEGFMWSPAVSIAKYSSLFQLMEDPWRKWAFRYMFRNHLELSSQAEFIFIHWSVDYNTIAGYTIALKVPKGHRLSSPPARLVSFFSVFHSHGFLFPCVPLPLSKALVANTSLLVCDPPWWPNHSFSSVMFCNHLSQSTAVKLWLEPFSWKDTCSPSSPNDSTLSFFLHYYSLQQMHLPLIWSEPALPCSPGKRFAERCPCSRTIYLEGHTVLWKVNAFGKKVPMEIPS